MGRLRIKRGPGKQRVPGKDFRLADEVRYIQRYFRYSGRSCCLWPSQPPAITYTQFS